MIKAYTINNFILVTFIVLLFAYSSGVQSNVPDSIIGSWLTEEISFETSDRCKKTLMNFTKNGLLVSISGDAVLTQKITYKKSDGGYLVAVEFLSDNGNENCQGRSAKYVRDESLAAFFMEEKEDKLYIYLGTKRGENYLVLRRLITPLLHPASARFPVKPSGQRMISDGANLLTADAEKKIGNVTAQLRRQKNISLYVVTIGSLSGYQATGMEIENYAQLLMDHWGISINAHRNDMLLLVSKGDREMRIHLGRGWSQQYDEQVENIINSRITPAFKQGKFSKGIVAGVLEMDTMARSLSAQLNSVKNTSNVKTPFEKSQAAESTQGGWYSVVIILGGIVLLVLIFVLIRSQGYGLLRPVAGENLFAIVGRFKFNREHWRLRLNSVGYRLTDSMKQCPVGYWLILLMYILLAFNSQLMISGISGWLTSAIEALLFTVQTIIWFLRLRIAWYLAVVIQIIFLLLSVLYALVPVFIMTFPGGDNTMPLILLLIGLVLIIINYFILQYLWQPKIKGLFTEIRTHSE